MITVIPITARATELRLRVCERLVDAIPEYGPHDILERLQKGVWALWRLTHHDTKGSTTAYFVTEFTTEGLLIPALVGKDRETWLDYIQKWSQEYAGANGFKRVLFYGRPGWRRDAEKRGWTHDKMIFSIPVERIN